MNTTPLDAAALALAAAARRRERDDVVGLEERGFSAWPAPQNVYFGGWVFRLGGGFTKRANSANALGRRQDLRADSINALIPQRDFAEVRAEAEMFYTSRGLPTIFRLTPLAGAEVDRALAEAGYEPLDPSLVMTGPLDEAQDHRDCVRIDPGPTPAWLNGVTAANGVAPSHRAAHDRIVQAIALPAGFATLYADGRPAGYGLCVIDRGAVGLFDIVIQPNARGRGAGRRLTQALMTHGRERGAEWAYLQVIAGNRIARQLYDSLGFAPSYGYHYRRKAPTA